LLKNFRDRLDFPDIPIKMYLRQRRRDDAPPIEEQEDSLLEETILEAEAEPSPRGKRRKRKEVDVSGLDFRTSVSEEDLESPHYDTELWQDL
jgi:hypothetical protein